MKNKLFVGNLSYDTTNETLQSHFAALGEVTDAVVISDRETGRSKGFGFVTYANEEDAQKAVDQLNGSSLDSREIAVSIARPREEGGPRRNFNGGGRRQSF